MSFNKPHVLLKIYLIEILLDESIFLFMKINEIVNEIKEFLISLRKFQFHPSFQFFQLFFSSNVLVIICAHYFFSEHIGISLTGLTGIRDKKIITEKAKGYVEIPVIDFIDFFNLIYDVLHMFLRIAGKLLELLQLDIITMDGNDGGDLKLRPNLNEFNEFLKNDCKLTNPLTLGKEIKLRAMQGPDLEKIF